MDYQALYSNGKEGLLNVRNQVILAINLFKLHQERHQSPHSYKRLKQEKIDFSVFGGIHLNWIVLSGIGQRHFVPQQCVIYVSNLED